MAKLTEGLEYQFCVLAVCPNVDYKQFPRPRKMLVFAGYLAGAQPLATIWMQLLTVSS
ncbi:MAG: hypothetical protein RLZZ458_737 [Planctomycetota bacterium]|jgi:hypothetical protein